MSVQNLVNKLDEEIKGEKRQKEIEVLEEQLTENIEELSKNENFFKLPLKNIFSVISKMDFNEIEEDDKTIEIIRNIIKNIIKKHFEEKETILILQNLNTETISFSKKFEEIFSMFELITNCPILVDFCNSYKEQNQLVDKDYEYELQQKGKEIEKLRLQISKNGIITEPEISEDLMTITEKPNECDELDIFKACKEGDLKRVKSLIEEKKVDKNKKLENLDEELILFYDDTPIHVAIKNGHLPIVKYLIEEQYVDIDIEGNDRKTPLHCACEKDSFPIVEYLISKDANIEAKDLNGKTPLHYACKSGNLLIVQYLISKCANLETKDNNGNCLIHFACQGGLLTIVQYLIEDQNIDKDIKGSYKTPLHYACENGHLLIVDYLISKGANLEAKDEYQDYLIHFATMGGLLSIVQFLIENKMLIKISKDMIIKHHFIMHVKKAIFQLLNIFFQKVQI